MQLATVSQLTAWANFYVIIGAAAGTLTGLTFVVITLVRDVQAGASSQGVNTFTTPTVVHFGLALFIAAILSAPWPTLAPTGFMLGLTGVGGVGYMVIILRRLLSQETYDPVLEDWLWHITFPFVAYIALVIEAIMLPNSPEPTLFGIGAVMVLLLFIGIHNAWDTIVYIAVDNAGKNEAGKDEAGKDEKN